MGTRSSQDQDIRRSGGVAAAVTVVGGTLVLGGSPAAALTIVVDSVADDGSGGTTLREAVVQANATPVSDTITFAPSVAGGTITLTGGPLGISTDLVVVGPGEESLTLTNAAGDVLYLYNGASLALSALTLSGAGDDGIATNASGDLALDAVTITGSAGNAIRFDSVSQNLTVRSSTLSGNTNDGIDVDDGDGVTVDISDSSLSDNRKGFYADDGEFDAVTIARSSFSDNEGTGLYFWSIGGDLTIADSIVDGNGDRGLSIDTALGGELSIVDSTISGNTSAGVKTGGIAGDSAIMRSTVNGNGDVGLYLNGTGGGVDVIESTIADNGSHGVYIDGVVGDVVVSDSSMLDNGQEGLYLHDVGGDVSVSDSTMSRNESNGIEVTRVAGSVVVEDTTSDDNQEAGFDFESTFGSIRLERVTVEGNSTDGVVFRDQVAAASIRNSTITGNGATPDASPIDARSGDVDIAHSTVSGNGLPGSTSAAIQITDAIVTVDHSIVTGNGPMPAAANSGLGAVAFTSSLLPVGSAAGASNVEADDPLLAPPADNGGSTRTMLPLEGSPVIDAGDPALTVPPAPLTDQRGSDRVVDVIDIGAVEVEATEAITSLPPARFVDTRNTGDTVDDRYEGEGKRSSDSEYRVEIAGRGEVPADAKAVVPNVTAVAAEGRGFVTVHPCVTPRPLASSLNYTEGVNLPNEIVAPLNADGELCLYTLRAAHLLVDVVGYVGADSPTVPVTPARYLDTRTTGVTFDAEAQRGGRTTAGGSVTLQVGDRGQVPADVAAVIANVTAVGPTERGFVTAHPCAPSVPNASSLNFVAGVNRANELVAPVNDAGELCLFTSSPVDLVVDVVGYIPRGSSLNPLVPRRFLDTRTTGETVDGLAEGDGKLTADSQVELQVAGRPGVPVAATAVVINVTAAAPETRGFVTVHPCVDPRPNASSLNYVTGVNGANELIARLDADGKICLYTNQRTHLIVDVVGWLS